MGAEGQSMTILPGETPCLQCLLQDAPPPGTTATCDTAGILGPIVNVIASIQACEALKILSGHREAINRTLLVVRTLGHPRAAGQARLAARDGALPDVPPTRCSLAGGPPRQPHGRPLRPECGAVELPGRAAISLDALARNLAPVGRVTRNRFLLRLEVDRYVITVFPDGRAIVGGTDDIAEARTIHARYIGA